MSGDFLSEFSVYKDLQDMKALKEFMETQLEDYNMTPGVVPMNLLLFRDAIEHSASENTTHALGRRFKQTLQHAWKSATFYYSQC